MNTWKPIVSAVLLITTGAVGQQNPAGKDSQQPAMVPTVSSSSDRPSVTPASVNAAPVASSPKTMEQVVDRTIQREHALMGLLRNRTPLVETYLQNLKRDPELGATPKDDRYFLGRLDLAANVERRDYLSKDESFEKNMLGGFGKLFKLEYNPMGFSWMIFADRDDFDRAHYDFKYIRREFLGDVRCFVFDVTPR